MQDKQIQQIYVTMQALFAVVKNTEDSLSHRSLQYQMDLLKEIMTPAEITVDMVLSLRAASGDGMIACQRALVKANGDHKLAIQILRGF